MNQPYRVPLEFKDVFLLHTSVFPRIQVVIVTPGGKYRSYLPQIIKYRRVVDITSMQYEVNTTKGSGYLRGEYARYVRDVRVRKQPNAH